MPEGYVTPNGNGGHDYVYQYKDHLGNIRLSYMGNNGNLEIVEENNYYPFGLRHKGYNNVVNGTHHPYTYNGKEEQEELGLNWLDYGARNYDIALGRFISVDIFAEKYENINPYHYAINNPMKFIDINGEYIYINDGGNQYRYENGKTQVKENGKWVGVENKELSDFVVGTITEVRNLEKSGETGESLVDFFSDNKNDVVIHQSKERNWSSFGNLGLNLNSRTNLFTENGYLPTDIFISLGHELAHLRDKVIRGQNAAGAEWFNNGEKISDSEIVASHVENLIRSESGRPLRTHYSELVGYNNGKTTIKPDETSRLIDANGNSKYYNSNGTRISPLPSISREIYGGEIFKNRFNYRNRRLNTNPKGIKD